MALGPGHLVNIEIANARQRLWARHRNGLRHMRDINGLDATPAQPRVQRHRGNRYVAAQAGNQPGIPPHALGATNGSAST